MLWPALTLSYYRFMRAHEFATLNSHGQTLQIKFLVSHNSQRRNPFTPLQCIPQIHLPTLLELLISMLLQSHHEFGLIFHGVDSPLTRQQLTSALCHLLQPQNTARNATLVIVLESM